MYFTMYPPWKKNKIEEVFDLIFTLAPPPLILDSSLQPSNKEMVLPSDLAVKFRFDQDVSIKYYKNDIFWTVKLAACITLYTLE